MNRYRQASLALCFSILAACGGGTKTANPSANTAKADAPKAEAVKTEPAKTENAAAGQTEKETPKAEENKPAGKRGPSEIPNFPLKMLEEGDEPTIFKLAGKELKVELCAMDTSVPDLRAQAFWEALREFAGSAKGELYVLDPQKKIRKYLPQKGDKCVLMLDPTFGDKGVLTPPVTPDKLDVLDDGTLVIKEFNRSHIYKNGKVESNGCEVRAELSGDGKVAWTLWEGKIQKGEYSEACPDKKEWKYTGWDKSKKEEVYEVRDWGNQVLLLGSAVSKHYIGIHRPDGTQQFMLGKSKIKASTVHDDDEFCSISDVDKCGAGLCVLDGNCRALSAWDMKNGNFIGTVKVSDLLGLFYPMPVGMVVTKGASYMAVTHDEKQPEDAPSDAKAMTVGGIFRITGLD
jgi:hypothetical protein